MNSLWQKEKDPDGVKAIIEELKKSPIDKDTPELETKLFSIKRRNSVKE